MLNEEKIIQDLCGKFKFLENQIKATRPRRIFLEVPYEHFMEVFDFCVRQLSFTQLCAMSGLDDVEKLSVMYHLAQEGGIVINLKTGVSREQPVLKTVMPYFLCAEIYERELVDLFGFKIEGLPDGNRYPLTDDWPKGEFPLRKDWKPFDQKKA
jgi:Ni,Fe-hydrogenase III component G